MSVDKDKDYGPPAKGDRVRSYDAVLILPPGGIATVMEAVHEALDLLSMTTCPYYTGKGICDRGCSQEPACQTDEPTEGWVTAGIEALARALPLDLDDLHGDAA